MENGIAVSAAKETVDVLVGRAGDGYTLFGGVEVERVVAVEAVGGGGALALFARRVADIALGVVVFEGGAWRA